MHKPNSTKSTLITPTIGRKVWFWPNSSFIGVPGTVQPQVFIPDQALDATVVCVHGDRMVNLFVVDQGGFSHSIRSVTLRQEGDAPASGMYCEWMPYQTGKTTAQAIAVQHDAAELAPQTLPAAQAPRLSPAHIEAQIVAEYFHVFPSTTVTMCMLTLKNGTKLLGHNYGSIDPTQQDWPTGRREARAMAVEKVWELEGYLLRETLAQQR